MIWKVLAPIVAGLGAAVVAYIGSLDIEAIAQGAGVETGLVGTIVAVLTFIANTVVRKLG